VLVPAVIVAAGMVFGGCVGVGGEDGGYQGEKPSGTDPPAPGEAPSGPSPPESTVTLGRRSETGVLGSYCWESASGAARCADAAGIPVPREDEALIVPRDWVLVFEYGGSARQARMDAAAYPLGRGN
jgi:hypothetical protein